MPSRADTDRFMHVPTFIENLEAFHVVVESPRGSSVKLKYEPRFGVVMWNRALTLGLTYPFDWGFIPGTRAADGDPLDAMILWEGSTYPGVVVPCRPLGLLQVEQNRRSSSGRERNDRVIAVPLNAPRADTLRDMSDVSTRIRDELATFFLEATAFENKNASILGWRDGRAALAMIEQSHAALTTRSG